MQKLEVGNECYVVSESFYGITIEKTKIVRETKTMFITACGYKCNKKTLEAVPKGSTFFISPITEALEQKREFNIKYREAIRTSIKFVPSVEQKFKNTKGINILNRLIDLNREFRSYFYGEQNNENN